MPGSRSSAGEPVFTLYTDTPERFGAAMAELDGAWSVGDTPPQVTAADHRSDHPSDIGVIGALDLEQIRQAPKALLHDHLDGGLRPATVLDIAGQLGYDGLPATDADELATWFRTQSHSGSLERYLEPFSHTVAVMQTPERCTASPSNAWRTWPPTRWSMPRCGLPPSCTSTGGCPSTRSSMPCWLGFAAGEKACAAAGRPITVRLLVTAMRHAAVSREIADWQSGSATRALSGSTSPAPRPATRRRGTWMRSSTCETTTRASLFMPARRSGCRPSTRRSRSAAPTGWAMGCGSSTTSRSFGRRFRLGRLASILRDKRIPLELCPSSNVQTGAVKSIAEHPFDLLARARFRVTVNTDNRLMSDTFMSREMHRLVEAFGYGWSDLERFTINAMKSAFIPFDERLAIIDDVIKPRYAVLIG